MKLFMPGPVPVRDQVLQAMSQEMISHRGKEASALQREISSYMKKMWNTESEIICSSSSGTGLMEGSLSSCVSGKTAVFAVGAFGERFYDIAQSLNIDADLYAADWGKSLDVEALQRAAESGKYEAMVLTHNETSTGVMHDLTALSPIFKAHPEILWIVDSVSGTGGVEVKADEWGIDIIITSTQKCLGLPPGMAFCTFSEKARKRAEKKEHRGYYFDLLKIANYGKKKDQYPSTPNISLMYGAVEQLKYIVEEEGLHNRYRRHQELQQMVAQWVRDYGEFFADENCRSHTVTTIKLSDDEKVPMLLDAMKTEGYQLASGYGKLKGKSFRIAHMADCTTEELEEMLTTLTRVYKNI